MYSSEIGGGNFSSSITPTLHNKQLKKWCGYKYSIINRHLTRISVSSNVQQLPPQPRPLPIIGNAHQLDFSSIFLSIEDLHKKMKTKVLRLSFFGQDVYCIRDADLFQEIISQKADIFTKPDTGKKLERWFGDGLVLQRDPAKHQQMKDLLSPAFKAEYLKCMLSTFAQASRDFSSKLQVYDGNDIQMEDAFHLLTLQILGLTMFSYDFHALNGLRRDISAEESGELNILQAHKDVVDAGMLLAFGVPLPNFLLPGYRKYIKGLESLDNAVNVIIKSRLSDGSWLTANDIIAFLLRAQKESNGVYPSDKQIRDEVISLLFAGSETTAQTLTFLFYCLATHPEAFHRVSQEAKRVIGNKNAQEISFEDLKQLRYITACINEALRLYPVAVDSPRIATRDDVIGNEFCIKKGTRVFLNQYSLHRHEQYWADPESFHPERFIPDSPEYSTLAARHQYAFMPFGAGPRSCIGRQFAMLSMQLAVTMIVQAVEFTTVAAAAEGDGSSDVQLYQAMSMKARGGMALRVVAKK